MYRFLTKRFFTREAAQPNIIAFANGVTIDIENKRVTLPDDFALHTTGNLRLTADKHVIIKSGQGDEAGRPGFRYSIWFNSDEDESGRPVMHESWIEDDGNNSK